MALAENRRWWRRRGDRSFAVLSYHQAEVVQEKILAAQTAAEGQHSEMAEDVVGAFYTCIRRARRHRTQIMRLAMLVVVGYEPCERE